MAVRRHNYRLRHYWTTAGYDLGYLLPLGLYEINPADSFAGSIRHFVRLAPLALPTFMELKMNVFVFFVPHRIIWDGWEQFITQSDHTHDESNIPTFVPAVRTGETGKPRSYTDRNNLLTFYGLANPSSVRGTTLQGQNEVSSLPIRGYNLIWNEFFRDQDEDDTVDEENVSLLSVSYKRDYFTSARTDRDWETHSK